VLSLLVAASTLLSSAGDGLPSVAPRAVGMSAERLAKIDHVVLRGIAAGGYPGASVVVGRKGAAVWERGFGRLSWGGDTRVVPARTIYDLASLTKVVATTTAIMILWDEGKLDLNDRVARFIPEFSEGAKSSVTIRHLLEHRSGLPAGRDLWRIAHSPEEARAAVVATPLMKSCRPGQCIEYSDLGADLLGFVAEVASGERLDLFLERRVYGPLGMTDTDFRPSWTLRDRIAPTEVTSPRGYPLRGEVHDENAYALGGIAGHAGLFSTATDLSIFAQMMLNRGIYNGVRIVSDSAVRIFTARSAGTRALGWDTCGGHGSCGKHLGERAFGHTGFTGTSLWIDPDREMFVILLTNRVHAARARRPSKVITDVRADLADAAALAVMDYGDPLEMPSSFRADRAVGWNQPTYRESRSARARSKAAKSRSARTKSSKSRSAKSSTAKKSTSKNVTSKKTPTTKKVTARKSSTKRTTSARKPTAKSTTAKKTSTRSSPTKKPVAKKTTRT
jgi:serine-type D-Ala-D-Ala carboxypeptidase